MNLTIHPVPHQEGAMTISGTIRSQLDKMTAALSAGLMNTRGTTLVEYALILLLIFIVVFMMVGSFGGTVNNTYCKINASLPT